MLLNSDLRGHVAPAVLCHNCEKNVSKHAWAMDTEPVSHDHFEMGCTMHNNAHRNVSQYKAKLKNRFVSKLQRALVLGCALSVKFPYKSDFCC